MPSETVGALDADDQSLGARESKQGVPQGTTTEERASNYQN